MRLYSLSYIVLLKLFMIEISEFLEDLDDWINEHLNKRRRENDQRL